MAQGKPIQSNQKVRVNRAFWLGAKVVEPGAEISLPTALAAELANARRVESTDHEPSDYHTHCVAEFKARAARKTGGAKARAVA